MANTNELHSRLLEDARRYDPAAHHRSLLAPYRDVVLLWRAKYMSYEQIAATLARNGLKVSPAAVGVFCRGNLTNSEIERVRKEQLTGPKRTAPKAPEPVSGAGRQPGQRGPRIARDDY